ncbi:MAG: DUF3489 domain-containing protein [Rubrivivax sp.]
MNAKSTPARESTRSAAKAAGRSLSKSRAAKVRSQATKRADPVAELTPTASKQSQLIAMLRSPTGGTIDQLTQLTGWQPHSVRGVISGALRKRLKLNVTCQKSVYRIVETRA